MASEAERYLRDLAASRLRAMMPNARIIHELNVETGQCRVDLVAAQPNALFFVEIKSRKDKLDRLPQQVKTFTPACNGFAVCYASERWDLLTMMKVAPGVDLWPQDKPDRWTFRPPYRPPNTAAMLNLLWADELRSEAVRAGLQPHSRDSRGPLMNRLWRALTGAEVVAAVCRQLRARPFAEADDPVFEADQPVTTKVFAEGRA